jgi:hypothetical protein
METISPCLGVRNACFIAITTATGEDNYISQMFSNKSTAIREMLSQIHVVLHCPECKQNGVSADECNRLRHCDSMLPPHKASADNEKVRLLMPDESLMGSEVYGQVRLNKNVFEYKWIDAVADKPRVYLAPGSVETCFSFIDPSGNGSQSDFTIVTVALVPYSNPKTLEVTQKIVVLGLSRDRNDQGEVSQARCTIQHFRSLRQLQCLHREALAVVFVESNYGGPAQCGTIQSLIDKEEFHPIHRFNEVIGKVGVRNTHYTKEEGVNMATHELSANNVYIASELCSSEPDKIKTTLKEFFDQLKRVHRKIKGTVRGLGFTYEYTGKMSATLRDDLAFGFIYCLQWMAVFQRHIDYLMKSSSSFQFQMQSMERIHHLRQSF